MHHPQAPHGRVTIYPTGDSAGDVIDGGTRLTCLPARPTPLSALIGFPSQSSLQT